MSYHVSTSVQYANVFFFFFFLLACIFSFKVKTVRTFQPCLYMKYHSQLCCVQTGQTVLMVYIVSGCFAYIKSIDVYLFFFFFSEEDFLENEEFNFDLPVSPVER